MKPLVESFQAILKKDDEVCTFEYTLAREDSEPDKEFMQKSKGDLNGRLSTMIDSIYPKPSIPQKNPERPEERQ
jgi:hypothetical protein